MDIHGTFILFCVFFMSKVQSDGEYCCHLYISINNKRRWGGGNLEIKHSESQDRFGKFTRAKIEIF